MASLGVLRRVCTQLPTLVSSAATPGGIMYVAGHAARRACIDVLATPVFGSTSCRFTHSGGAAEEKERHTMASKLLYRSKQRGFLELDLLVGLWSEKNIPTMSLDSLKQLAVVLDQENPDLFKWLTGQLPPSEEMAQNKVFQTLKVAVNEQLAQHSQPRTQAPSGREWVRGWTDIGITPPAPPAAAPAK